MPYTLQHTRDVINLSYDSDLITAFIEFHGVYGMQDFGLFFKMCLIDLVASTSHAKVPSKAPSTGLSRTSLKT